MSRLQEMLDEAQRVVVFTGAGISTESGIPDFRSPGGIWTKYQPIYFDDFLRSEETRREAWRRKIKLDEAFAPAKPNRGHRAVAELTKRGKVTQVITQNIDNLHQQSGIPEEQIIELHGNGTYARCLDCNRRYELDPILQNFKKIEELPICKKCGGIIKAATISFGQPMPELAMRQAEEAALACDLFLAIGSSLVVFPAAGFPIMARENGARLIILNRETTEMDTLADLVLHEEIGPALGEAVGID